MRFNPVSRNKRATLFIAGNLITLIISLLAVSVLVYTTHYRGGSDLSSILNGPERPPIPGFGNFTWGLYLLISLLAVEAMRYIINSRTKNMELEMERLQLEKANLNLQTQSLQLQKNNLNLELSFLKSQINPHFLFNTLNAIYTRTVDVDEQAADLVLKLSDLMRYSLYESSRESVVLSREIGYIENYLDLERARFADKVTIDYQLHGNPAEYLIAPLLLVSFVENAFKHGTAKSQYASYVKLSIKLHQNTLYFNIRNNLPQHARQSTRRGGEQVGGFGLSNTTKRLELLYPGQHRLSVQQTESEFAVNLELELSPVHAA